MGSHKVCFSYESKFFPFTAEPFLEEDACAGTQRDILKDYLPFKKLGGGDQPSVSSPYL